MSYEPYHKTTIDCKQIRPHVKELIDRCGDATAAGQYALVGKSTLLRIMNGVNCSVQKATAAKILVALDHRRIEDRKNKQVHERLLKARQEQARIEAHQQRLLGY
jgi:hypothetical protein